MSNFIKYLTLCFLFCYGGNLAHGQMITRLDNFGGHPNVTEQKYIDIKGNPFFYEDWTTAVVYAKNGNEYIDVLLKYDIVNDEIQFFVPSVEQAYVLDTPIDSFKFVGPNTENHFVKLSDGKFYERLSKGHHNLYKETNKYIIERRPYGSAHKERTVLTKTNYYYEHEGKLEPLKPNRRAVLNLFSGDQRKALEDFIKDNRVNLSNENGMVQAFTFVNNLPE